MHPSDQARWQVSVNSWLDQDTVTAYNVTPAINEIGVDTGELPAGFYDFRVILGSTTVYSYFAIEHRNAANDANLHSVYVVGNAYKDSITPLLNWKVAGSERLRIRFNAASGGGFTLSIIYTRRA